MIARRQRRQDARRGEQLTVVDPETQLGKFAGRLGATELRAVNAALMTVSGVD